MFLRMTWGAYAPSQETAIRSTEQAQLVPALKAQAGFDSYLSGMNPSSGSYVGLSLWAIDNFATPPATPVTHLNTLARLQPEQGYRVVVIPAGFPQRWGTGNIIARLATAQYDPQNETEMKSLAKLQLLPLNGTVPGLLGFLVGAQQSTGQVAFASFWKDVASSTSLDGTASKYSKSIQFGSRETFELTPHL